MLNVSDSWDSTCHSESLSVSQAHDSWATLRRPAVELAEIAAEVVAPLIGRLSSRHGADLSALRAIGALDFGAWIHDPLGRWDFHACLDTALLAKLSGVTVVDDFPARDQAHGGRGGPCEAAGIWMMLADRGIMPGRLIRAMVELADTAQVILLPPRQSIQLPNQLQCGRVLPVMSLLDGLSRYLFRQASFDPREQLAIQGRTMPDLRRAWDAVYARESHEWSPVGVDAEPYLQVVMDWPDSLTSRAIDVMCTAIQWIADWLIQYIREQLPQSQPVGHLILAGRGRHHTFLTHQLQQQLPGLQFSSIDDMGVASESWEAVSAALLAMLHVDQIPANTYALTGVKTPRVLGRMSPGPPGNWHGVLAEMARTLPEKMTLRSAI